MILFLVPTALADCNLSVSNVSFFDSTGTEITNSVNGEVYATVDFNVAEPAVITCIIAVYNGSALSDVSISRINADRGNNTYTSGNVRCSEDSIVKLFLWEDMKSLVGTIRPSDKNISLEYFAVDVPTLDGYTVTRKGAINPLDKTITIDIPTKAQSGGKHYSNISSLKNLTPSFRCAPGFSVLNAGNMDFTAPFTLTVTNGSITETYKVIPEFSDLDRASDFEGLTIITPSSSYFSTPARRGMPAAAGHFGLNGIWKQSGMTVDDDGNIVDDQSCAIFSWVEHNGSSDKAFQITKTKTGKPAYMYSVTGIGGKTVEKYQLDLSLKFTGVTGTAYVQTSRNGKLYFVKNAEGRFDLYYKDTIDDTAKKFADNVIGSDEWFDLMLIGRTSFDNQGIIETKEVYINSKYIGKTKGYVDTIASTYYENLELGFLDDSLGTITFDNWTTTFIETEINPENPTIYFIGDSICCTYPRMTPEGATEGWFTQIYKYFDTSRVTLSDIAISGATCSTYLDSSGSGYAKWQNALNNMKPGDFVVVSLGQNESGSSSGFKSKLAAFAEAARAKDGDVIYTTPTIRATEFPLVNHMAARTAQIIELGEEIGATVLDLNTTQWNLFKDLTWDELVTCYEGTDDPATGTQTPETNPKYYGDFLHFRIKGAQLNAKIITDLLRESNSEAAEYLRGEEVGKIEEFSLTVGGEKYKGQIMGKTIRVEIPGRTGGLSDNRSLPDISSLVPEIVSTGTVLDANVPKDFSNTVTYTLVGVSGRTKTYTVETEFITKLIEMDFQDTVINSDGTFQNKPALNCDQGTNGVWRITGTNYGTVSIAADPSNDTNKALKLSKTATGGVLRASVSNIEYAAETEKIVAEYKMMIPDISATATALYFAVGENLPRLGITKNGFTGGYGLGIIPIDSTSFVVLSDSPTLSFGKWYTVKQIMRHDIVANKVTTDFTITGENINYKKTISYDVASYYQAALLPQFSVYGYSNGLFTVYIDDVYVGYNAKFDYDKINVYLIGDSICYTYPPTRTEGIQGWGKYVATRFDSEHVKVINCAREGHSSQMFLTGGLLSTDGGTDHRYDIAEGITYIQNTIRSGDYVMIGIGWNDSKYISLEQYKENLKTMISIINNAGAVPILVTHTVARGTTVVDNAKLPWTNAMKDVSAETGTLLLDLNTSLYNKFSSENYDTVRSYYYDGVHFGEEGAKVVGNLICDLLDQTDCPLKAYLKKPEKEPTDTSSTLITFNDMEVGTINPVDSRITYVFNAGGNASVVYRNEATGDKALSINVGSLSASDNVTFNMEMSGKSKYIVELDFCVVSHNGRSDGLFNINIPGLYLTYLRASSTKLTLVDRYNTESKYVNSLADFETGKWYHLKFVYTSGDADTVNIDTYVDGVLTFSGSKVYDNSNNNNPVPPQNKIKRVVVSSFKAAEGSIIVDNISISGE